MDTNLFTRSEVAVRGLAAAARALIDAPAAPTAEHFAGLRAALVELDAAEEALTTAYATPAEAASWTPPAAPDNESRN